MLTLLIGLLWAEPHSYLLSNRVSSTVKAGPMVYSVGQVGGLLLQSGQIVPFLPFGFNAYIGPLTYNFLQGQITGVPLAHFGALVAKGKMAHNRKIKELGKIPHLLQVQTIDDVRMGELKVIWAKEASRNSLTLLTTSQPLEELGDWSEEWGRPIPVDLQDPVELSLHTGGKRDSKVVKTTLGELYSSEFRIPEQTNLHWGVQANRYLEEASEARTLQRKEDWKRWKTLSKWAKGMLPFDDWEGLSLQLTQTRGGERIPQGTVVSGPSALGWLRIDPITQVKGFITGDPGYGPDSEVRGRKVKPSLYKLASCLCETCGE